MLKWEVPILLDSPVCRWCGCVSRIHGVSNNDVSFLTRTATSVLEGENTLSILGPTANIYDPKILYNAMANKFILMALHGSSSSLSELYIAYSVSNDPMDGWCYSIDGNPGDLSSWWFDYPSIGHSAEDLFISGNMLNSACTKPLHSSD